MKIYIVGNPLVDDDRLPIKILPDLQKAFPLIRFEIVDPNENFPPPDEKVLVILDTVKGIDVPKLFSLDNIADNYRLISPHDYDLGVHLLLLKKLKKINSASIVGIPVHMSPVKQDILYQIISTLL